MPGKKILIALVAGALLAGGVVALDLGVGADNVSAAGPAPKVIDARTDPTGAYKALNQYCNPGPNGVDPTTKKLGNCDYDGSISQVQYAAPRTIGDAVYNCGPTIGGQAGYADDSVEVTDSRSTDLTTKEGIEASVTVGFAKLALSFDTSQWKKIDTTRSVTEAVEVAAGQKGWVDSQAPEGLDTATLTDLMLSPPLEITNVDFTVPGVGNDSKYSALFFTHIHQAIDPTDPGDRNACQGLTLSLPPGARGAGPESGVRILICPSTPARRRRRGRRCTTRFVSSAAKPALRIRARTGVALTRRTREYASGIAGKKRIVLHAQRRVRPGRYLLVLSGRRHSTIQHVTVH